MLKNGSAQKSMTRLMLTFNATFDEQENRWKAGQFMNLKGTQWADTFFLFSEPGEI